MGDPTEMNRFLIEVQQEYVNFLDDSNGDEIYIGRIKDMIQKGVTRLIVNVNDLREKNLTRCNRLLENGFEEMPQFQKALREVVASVNTDYVKHHDEFYIGLEGSFGSKHVTPRTLAAHFLGNTVCVEGIVTKCSLIRPKVVRSVHYCPATHKTMERRYADASSYDVLPSVAVYPTKDDDGNLLETEYGLSRYRDHQMITIQEMPEKAPTGQLPRSLDISLDNDLVDTCKPGDRVLIVGVYRCLPGKQGGFTTGIFKSVLLGTHVTLMHKDVNFHVTDQEIKEIRNFPKRNSNPVGILAKSLAPSIHGHEFIKKAVLCLLLGGVEKTLPNGTRLRGDINVLLIGDPSVAKSQMLRYVANVAPRVVMTTGRGSSGVGLTAAVTTDMETGDRRLEAGAMVLADRGIVCIDEFDKMSDADRTAIHEVMEQGRVTIAKAGIHARLNARTAVLAAANPVYGRYDEYKTPMENIGLQDSLLSRFDLLFVILDTADQEKDRMIADHVLRMHRYRNPTEQDGEATSLFDNEMTLSTYRGEDKKAKAGPLTAYEKHDPLLHGKYRTRGDRILCMEFVKKYIHVAKQIKPTLTSEASRVIVEEYTRIRSNPEDINLARTQPITARSLETLIRLSTAHAKARLSIKVEEQDAHAAIELLQYAIFKKVLAKKKKRRHNSRGEESDSGNEEMEVEDGNENEENGDEGINGTITNAAKRPRGAETDENAEAGSSDQMDVDNTADPPVVRVITDDAYSRFKNRFSQLFEMEREESLTQVKIVEWLTAAPQNFTEGEVLGGLDRLTEEGKIMISEGIVFLF